MSMFHARRKHLPTMAVRVTDIKALSKVTNTCYEYKMQTSSIEFVVNDYVPAVGGYIVAEGAETPVYMTESAFNHSFEAVAVV